MSLVQNCNQTLTETTKVDCLCKSQGLNRGDKDKGRQIECQNGSELKSSKESRDGNKRERWGVRIQKEHQPSHSCHQRHQTSWMIFLDFDLLFIVYNIR